MLRILVVDDCEDTRVSLCVLLRIWGHDPRHAGDGQAAVESARAFLPHVILLDIAMPGMDGYDVARLLRLEPELKDTVLIAVTGYGREQDVEQSRAAGFQRHLLKPFDLEELQRFLRTLLLPHA